MKTKLNLPLPGNPSIRLLFSNVSSPDSKKYYLLMTFHKSRKGGFDYPVTAEECKEALKRKGLEYIDFEEALNLKLKKR